MLSYVTPGSMATAGVLRRNQVRLLGSNQQPSRPLRRLLLGGWTTGPELLGGVARHENPARKKCGADAWGCDAQR